MATFLLLGEVLLVGAAAIAEAVDSKKIVGNEVIERKRMVMRLACIANFAGY